MFFSLIFLLFFDGFYFYFYFHFVLIFVSVQTPAVLVLVVTTSIHSSFARSSSSKCMFLP